MNEQREKYIILLLGASEKPCPTMWHVQKELFILSKVNPKLQELFRFEKHYQGPYSQVLQDLVHEPAHHGDAYTYDNRGYYLTAYGRVVFDGIVEQYENNENFGRIFKALQLIRQMYDPLSKDELLFLVYTTYPEYTELSSEYERLVGDKRNRKRMADTLLHRGLVTKERYNELIGNTLA
jgi:uncharacterized protein YwgA